MEKKSRAASGTTKIMHNGVKIYVNPCSGGGIVRSAKNRQLTETEAIEAFELAEGISPKSASKFFVNTQSAYDFKIVM